MSQSLVLMIRHFGEITAGIYYRWSGYSDAALKEAREVANCIYAEEDLSVQALQLRLIRMVEENGGGIDCGVEEYEELHAIQSMFPNQTFKTQNIKSSCGLIAITEKGIDELVQCAGSIVTIDMDNEEVENEAFFDDGFDFSEYQKKGYIEDENASIEDIPDVGVNLWCFPISKLDSVIEKIDQRYCGLVRNKDTIYELIV